MGGMQRSTRNHRHHTPAQREEILTAYERSNKTQREFAARAGIGYSTLTLWLRKSGEGSRSRECRFVPVPNLLPAASSSAAAYRIQLPRGVIVEVARGFESAELEALMRVVGGI